jgi:hypothetical protein
VIGARTAHSESGSPCENGDGKSFNSNLRYELPMGEILYSLKEVWIVIESRWRHSYPDKLRPARSRWSTRR